jgi:hypothetical protein
MERIVYGWQTCGVCDRLTAMLLLYCIAQKTGRKALWHWVANPNCNAPFHSLFETDVIEVSEDTFGLDGVTIGEGWGWCRAVEVIQRAEQEKDCQVQLLRDGYFGHNFEGLDEIIRPCREVDRRVTQFMEWNWSDKMIGVHVRRADRNDCGLPSVEQYFAALDGVLCVADAGIFLSSDDPTVVDQFAQRYCSRVSVYPVSSYDRNSARAIVDAVVSLYLLRNTHGIIGSSVSGYSICAGWDCGLINLPPDRCYNFSWSGDALAFKPPRLINVQRASLEQDSQWTHHEHSSLNHPASAV